MGGLNAHTRVHVSELSFTHPVDVLSDVLIPCQIPDCIPGIGSDQMPANGQGFDSLFPFPIYSSCCCRRVVPLLLRMTTEMEEYIMRDVLTQPAQAWRDTASK
jgi:hypothetical protein